MTMTGHRLVNVHDKMPDRKYHGNLEANINFLQTLGVLQETGQILEIGSGKGELLRFLTEQGLDIEGVDINEDFVTSVQEQSVDFKLTLVHGTTLPYEDETFDLVISFDVLEHIPNTDAHLQEVRRVLKPGGVYLLQSPNKWTNTIFETIRWRSFTKWRAGHCSLHSFRQFRERFRKHGFTTEFYDIPVVTKYFRKKLRAYTGVLGEVMLPVLNPDRLPIPLRTNFYIEATKLPESGGWAD